MDWNRFLYQARNLRSNIQSGKVLTGVAVAKHMGLLSIHGRLGVELCKRGGFMHNLGTVGRRVVTDAGVAFLVDDWDNGTNGITLMNYHDSGVGVVAENVTDVNLGTESGPTTRATGTKSQPSANVLRSIGTIAYTGTLAITEHGLFSTAARTTDELWDRTVFAAVNVESGDSIQFTYDCTLTAGS